MTIFKEGLKLSEILDKNVKYIDFKDNGFIIIKNFKVIVTSSLNDNYIETFWIGSLETRLHGTPITEIFNKNGKFRNDLVELLNIFNLTFEEFEEQHPEYFI